MSTTYVALDTETTGLEAGSRVVEIAAICFNTAGRTLDVFAELINPNMVVPPDATAIHGLTSKCLADQSSTSAVLGRFVDWLPSEAVVLAHNAPFDLGLLHWECERVGLKMPVLPVVDTLRMLQTAVPAGACGLGDVVKRCGLSFAGKAHRALPDADAVRQLFLALGAEANPSPMLWTPRYHYTETLPKPLADLPNLVQRASAISFTYTDKLGRTFPKTVTPYGWAVCRGGLQFHGLCHYTGKRRIFIAERMAAG